MASGEIYDNSKSYSFVWKIPDFLPSDNNHYYEEYNSPHVELCGASWHFRICCNGRKYDPIYVFLVKEYGVFIDHLVFYELSVVSNDGKSFVTVKGEQKFWNDIFASPSLLLFRKIELIQERRRITSKDIITLYCTIKFDLGLEMSSPLVVEESDEEYSPIISSNSKKLEGKCATGVAVTPSASGLQKLSEDFKNLFINGYDSDVLLIVRDRKFPVHRAILGARSPVFASMFEQEMSEKCSGIVEISDCDPDAFHDFLLYLYCAETERLTVDNVLLLYWAADKYDVQQIKEKSVVFMKRNLTIESFCSIISLALRHKESELLETAIKFFVKNLKEIVVTAKWQSFLKENPVSANELLIKASKFYVIPE